MKCWGFESAKLCQNPGRPAVKFGCLFSGQFSRVVWGILSYFMPNDSKFPMSFEVFFSKRKKGRPRRETWGNLRPGELRQLSVFWAVVSFFRGWAGSEFLLGSAVTQL